MLTEKRTKMPILNQQRLEGGKRTKIPILKQFGGGNVPIANGEMAENRYFPSALLLPRSSSHQTLAHHQPCSRPSEFCCTDYEIQFPALKKHRAFVLQRALGIHVIDRKLCFLLPAQHKYPSRQRPLYLSLFSTAFLRIALLELLNLSEPFLQWIPPPPSSPWLLGRRQP